ncbi:hypothetical protein MMC29_002623 [Sticta canariensis]|nr:hypothetical protein [Sticta canariensis]
MPENDKLLDFLKESNIFDLDLIDNGLIAGTRIEIFYEIRPMLEEFLQLEMRLDLESYEMSEEEIRFLYYKYPRLGFITSAPGMGNPYTEAVIRLLVWSRAQNQLDLPASEKEKEATEALIAFHFCMSTGWCAFLKEESDVELKEMYYVTHHALDELWEMTQRLKLRPLTQAQEADRKRLESFVTREVRVVLIHLEYENVSRRKYGLGQSAEWRRRFEEEDRRVATRIVDERIAKGDWQGPGPHKFKFNGI